MQTGLSGWTPGQHTAVIDLGEEFAPDPSNASSAALQFSAAYYAVDSSAEGNGSKKRKVERACDFCRKRKARCDGPKMPDNICSNCIANSRSCTYLEGSKPRGPPKAYVVGLEDRIERIEALLKRLRPESDFSVELGPPIIRDSWKSDAAPPSASDKARSDSPKPIDPPPSITKKQSIVSLTAPPPNRARPAPSLPKDNGPPNPRSASDKKTPKKNRIRGAEDSGSNSDHDASCSSLSDSSDTDDDPGELSIVRGIKRLTLRGLEPAQGTPDNYLNDNQFRFHGKSSSFKLISTTRELIHRHIVETSSDGRQSNSPGDIPAPSPMNNKRPEFWSLPPWEKAYEHADVPTFLPDWLLPAFPPQDLGDKLTSDYFDFNNSTFTLLHRPTFERQWRDKLYTKNVWFACVCLGIFGIASRWSLDPRVLPDEIADKANAGGNEGIWTLAGWKYITTGMKIHESRRSVLLPPELFEIQSFALIAQYFRGTVAQAGSWFYLSVGVLKAQDVGAHRRKIYGRKPTVEEELWKRAYWHLVAFDRVGSMLIGRPCCSREEDLDLDLPLEVDDEHWENDDPELAFRQPEGKPSLTSCFVQWIKLSHIIAYALKTLYTPNKSTAVSGSIGSQWKEQTVERLNDALSKWLEELPTHLRWRPDMEDRAFASQAATLYTTYHLVQILIYRPFIRIPRVANGPISAHRSTLSQKALSICLNSARAGAYILDVQTRRGMLNITNVVHVSFICAGVFLVHLWDLLQQFGSHRVLPSVEVRARMSQEISSVMGEIGDVMARLEEVSPKWELAREMLDEIKDALPASPSDDVPKRLFPDMDASAVTPYDSATGPVPGLHNTPSSSRVYPQMSPLTPPEHYELHGYHQDYVHVPRPSMSRPVMTQYPSQRGILPFPFDGNVHQLWDMDGAPASPPPLPDFNLFMPSQTSQHAQHYQPPLLSHKTSHPPSIYTSSQPIQPIPESHRNAVPTIPDTTHRASIYQPIRQPQPHPIRTNLTPAYAESYRPPPRSYAPGSSPTDPSPLQSDYRASFCKSEDEGMGDHECLRLRLLEETYRQRQHPGVPPNANANVGGGTGGAYGGSGSPHHPPDQWENGGHRWS